MRPEDELITSRSRYLLNLCTAQRAKELNFIEILDQLDNILNEVKEFIPKRCMNACNYFGKLDCTYCEIPEYIPSEYLPNNEKVDEQSCPINYLEGKEVDSCAECIGKDDIPYSATFLCEEIKLGVAFAHGSYDTIQLWKVPDYYWGLHITSETQHYGMFSDIMSIPSHRIKRPFEDQDTVNPIEFKEPIICFTFIELHDKNKNENQEFTLTENILTLRNKIYHDDNKDKWPSMFLSYSCYPIILKSEFKTENAAHKFIVDLRKYNEIKSTSTIYAINPEFMKKHRLTDGTHIFKIKDDDSFEINREVLYVIAAKINKVGIIKDFNRDSEFKKFCKEVFNKELDKFGHLYKGNIFEILLNIILNHVSFEDFIQAIMNYEIQKYNDSMSRDLGLSHKITLSFKGNDEVLLQGEVYHMRGFWDCIIPIISSSSFATIQFIIRHLRNQECIDQVISIPLWNKKYEVDLHE